MDVLTKFILVILSQSIRISNHQIAYLKYTYIMLYLDKVGVQGEQELINVTKNLLLPVLVSWGRMYKAQVLTITDYT